ncbi:variable surface protein [Plasmodium gonderi]|uniref:Variable surface protein n=1 Tax=Plasmodium gonderi TaxID=77519 RepID=A0A1Y1JI17_PLAGO|nr:variable surface protein [Plasmodium gonderi]GAW80432.1 variable surface protein [Plasmodium gonderi]
MSTNKSDELIWLSSSYNYRRLNGNAYKSFDDADEIKCEVLHINLGKKYYNFMDFCMKITGILKKFNVLSFTGTIDIDKCTIVNIWMYEQIYNMLKVNSETNASKVINELRNIWNNYSQTIHCDIRSDLGNMDNFTRYKKIYDHAINYESILLHLVSKNYACTKKFKDYLVEIDNIYNTLKGTETADDITREKVLQYFGKVHREKKLSPSQCLKVIEEAPVSSRNVETMSSPKESEEALGHRAKGKSELQEPSILLTTEAVQASDKPFNVSSVVIPLLLIPIISFILYKFTPAKVWLDSLYQKRNQVRSFLYGEDYKDYLENIYEMGNNNHQMKSHEIGYHPV